MYPDILMEDYELIDAALDGVRNYMRALNADERDLEIHLKPKFDEKGEAVEINYSIGLSVGIGSETHTEVRQEFQWGQGFEVGSSVELDYSEWIEKFTSELPEADLHYMPYPEDYPLIEDSIDGIDSFLKIFMENTENVSVLMDPVYDDEKELGHIDYHIRTRTRTEENPKAMDLQAMFRGTEEEFHRIYPIVINNLEQEYPEAEFFYPDADEI